MFVALFTTFGMQYFAGGVLEQGDIQIRQFPNDGVRRRVKDE